RARKQFLGLEQPLLVPGSVITVEHFEYERSRDAGQSVDVLRLDLQRLLIEIAGADHRLPRRWSIGDHLGTHEKVGGVGAFWPLTFGTPAFDVNHLKPMALAKRPTISSWTSKRSVRSTSNRSAQSCAPARASTSFALTRSLSPSGKTLPVSA